MAQLKMAGALGPGFRPSMARPTDEVVYMRDSVWSNSWPTELQFSAFDASVAVDPS
jgi:hypothetical protein